MTQPTQPPERRGTFADLRPGQAARIRRVLLRLENDTTRYTAEPDPDDQPGLLVEIQAGPEPCEGCGDLIARGFTPSGGKHVPVTIHRPATFPVVIVKDPS